MVFESDATDLPLMLPSLLPLLLRLGNPLKDPLGVANEPCCYPKFKKKPGAIEVSHSLNSVLISFSLCCFTLLYFWVLIRLKRYLEVPELLYTGFFFFTSQFLQMVTKMWEGKCDKESYIKILFENILTFWSSPEIKTMLFFSDTLVKGFQKMHVTFNMKQEMYNFQVICHKL